MSLKRGGLQVDLDVGEGALTIVITPGTDLTQSLVLKSSIFVQREGSYVTCHDFPPIQVAAAEYHGGQRIPLPPHPLPDEDFVVGAWLMNENQQVHGVNKAYRLRGETTITSYTFESLDPAELDAELEADRIDKATYNRRYAAMYSARRRRSN